jgi:hypothetical protein
MHRHPHIKMVVIFLLVFLAAVTVTAAERLVHLLPYIAIALAAYLAGKHRERRALRRAVRRLSEAANRQEQEARADSGDIRCDVVSAYPPEVKPGDWSSEDSGQWPEDTRYSQRPERDVRRETIVGQPMSGAHDLYGNER